jgi:peptide/nickel transport system permease protein
MAARLVTRLFDFLLVLVGVALLVFLLLHLIPGDPVEVMLGEAAHPADKEVLRTALGLDRPLWWQLADYARGLAQLDLGTSLHSRRPVVELLAERIPASFRLGAAAFLLTVVISLPLGLVAARYRGRWPDRLASGFALLGLSIPNFWLGPLLILCFSVWLGWTPVSGAAEPGSLVLPTLTLGLSLAALNTRMVRASLLEVMHEDYVRTARAKGRSAAAALWRHALPNALLPVLTLLGLQLGGLLAGTVITEVVFSWHGIGSLMVEAIRQRDYPVVQGCVLLVSLVYVGFNALVDALYGVVDPRVRNRA